MFTGPGAVFDFDDLPVAKDYHAPLSPSGMKPNALCTGRYRFTKNLPNLESEDARKGTTAHDLYEGWLKKTIPFNGLGESFMGSNKESIDAENIEFVREAYFYVADLMKDMPFAIWNCPLPL